MWQLPKGPVRWVLCCVSARPLSLTSVPVPLLQDGGEACSMLVSASLSLSSPASPHRPGRIRAHDLGCEPAGGGTGVSSLAVTPQLWVPALLPHSLLRVWPGGG